MALAESYVRDVHKKIAGLTPEKIIKSTDKDKYEKITKIDTIKRNPISKFPRMKIASAMKMVRSNKPSVL